MSNKIPNDYNDVIYEEYENLLAVGVPISRIADLVNEKFGTNFAESSLRGRYIQEKNKRGASPIENEEEYQKRLLKIAQAQINLRHEQKLVVKERSVINSMLRESTDREAVADAFVRMWDRELVHYELVDRYVERKYPTIKGYSYADAHLGYISDLAQNIYNPEVAAQRIHDVFDNIIADVRENGYKEIFISDQGDGIEGAALRVSQLVRIAEDMTVQAKMYANLIAKELKRISEVLNDVQILFIMISSDNHSELRLYNTKRGDLTENLQLLITNHVQAVVETAQEYGGMQNIEFVQGDEVMINFNGKNVVFTHGHQYSKHDNILENVEHRHNDVVMGYIAGHWHRFSVKYRNVKNGAQQVLVHLPAVVGDTDFSDKLFVSSIAGFCKIEIDTDRGYINAHFVPLQ